MLNGATGLALQQTLYLPHQQQQQQQHHHHHHQQEQQHQQLSKINVQNADENLRADKTKTPRKNRTKFNSGQVLRPRMKQVKDGKFIMNIIQVATLENLFQRNNQFNFRKMIPTIAQVCPC